MENAMRTAEKTMDKIEGKMNGHSGNIALADSAEKFLHAATDIASQFKNVSGDAVKGSVSFVKKYPLHTALGAVAIGFFAGILVRRS